MKRSTLIIALTIPLGMIAALMAPMIMAFVRPPDWGLFFPVLVSFGLPQYLVFAPVLGFLARRRSGAELKRLMLWAPVLFIPFLIAPIVLAQPSLDEALKAGAMMAALGLMFGYVCVAIAAGLWFLAEPRSEDTL